MPISPRARTLATLLAALVTAGTVAVVGCATTASKAGTEAEPQLISPSEIEAASAVTAYELIRKLRPMFLSSRGRLSLDPRVASSLPRVYVDNQFYGDISVLSGIMAATIDSIRFYSGSSAQQKFGHDNAAGVISISTKQ